MRSSSFEKASSLTENAVDFAAEMFDLSACYNLHKMNSDSTLNFYEFETNDKLPVKVEMSTTEPNSTTVSNVKLEFDVLNYSEPSLDLSLLDASITTPEVNQLMAGFFPGSKMLPAETLYSSTNVISEDHVAEPEFVELEQSPISDIDNEHNYTARAVIVDTDEASGASSPSSSDVKAEFSSSETVEKHAIRKSKLACRKRKNASKSLNSYQEKRRRNNEAVRKSREKTKLKQLETQAKVDSLTKENEALQTRVDQLSKELEVLKQLFTVFQTRSGDS